MLSSAQLAAGLRSHWQGSAAAGAAGTKTVAVVTEELRVRLCSTASLCDGLLQPRPDSQESLASFSPLQPGARATTTSCMAQAMNQWLGALAGVPAAAQTYLHASQSMHASQQKAGTQRSISQTAPVHMLFCTPPLQQSAPVVDNNSQPARKDTEARASDTRLDKLFRELQQAHRLRDHHAVTKIFSADIAVQGSLTQATVMFSTLLNAWSKLGRVDRCLEVLQNMKHQNIRIDLPAYGCVVFAFGSTGRLQEAISYLNNEVPQHLVAASLYNTIITCCLHQRKNEIADQCMQAMEKAGVAWDAGTWSLLFRQQAARQDFAQLQQTVSHFQRSDCRQDVQGRAAAVAALGHCGQLHAAVSEVKSLLGDWQVTGGAQPASADQAGRGQPAAGAGFRTRRHVMQACHTAVHAAERAGEHVLLQSVLDCMRQVGLASDTAIHNSLLRVALANDASSADISDIIASMSAEGAQPDIQSYTVLLQAKKREGDAIGARTVMDQLLASGMQPSIQAWNALLEVWAAQGNAFETARLYSDIKHQGVKPDTCTFIALFESLWQTDPAAGATSQKQAWQARDEQHHMEHHLHRQVCELLGEQLGGWVEDMARLGLVHSPASFTALVQAYGRLDRLDAAMQLLKSRKRAGLYASVHAYNAALGACTRLGRVNDALQLMRHMESAGVPPNEISYTALMFAHLTANTPESVPSLVKEMQERALMPTPVTFSALIQAHLQMGNVRDAMLAVDTAEGAGLRMDTGVWQALLAGAKQHRHSALLEAANRRIQGDRDAWAQLAQTFTFYGSGDDEEDDDLF